MSNKKILVVEDDADVRLGYHVLLKANQYDTCFAADSLSAVTEARKHQPDLIILDLGLPAGDGFIVLQRIRANANLTVVPVVVVTARDRHGNMDRALKAGARAFVQKPWNDDELLAIIRQLVDQPERSISPPQLPTALGAGSKPPYTATRAVPGAKPTPPTSLPTRAGRKH